MNKKTLWLASLLITASVTFAMSRTAHAHDEGHGPKLTDTGKYGGIVSPVVKKSEADRGAKAELVYKAELARSTDGTVRVYLYDKDMKPLDLKSFEGTGTANLASKVKGQWKNETFALNLKNNVFTGQMAKPKAKPYNIDITLKSSGTELLSAFDNLD